MKTQLDHLVVVATTLEQGVVWCQDTLGITPSAGGEHPQYGTHNRLFKIATPAFPMAYFEIIAINPAAANARHPARRWFDMDDARLQSGISGSPRLVHFVVNTDDMQAACAALTVQGIDRGQVLRASRSSSKGTLEWQITVREDGQRLFDGALPSLIQWGGAGDDDPLRMHPRNQLPRSGVSLRSLQITHPSAAQLQDAYGCLGLGAIALQVGPANLTAHLQTPRGLVVLQSMGL